jgi:hypothetical protein
MIKGTVIFLQIFESLIFSPKIIMYFPLNPDYLILTTVYLFLSNFFLFDIVAFLFYKDTVSDESGDEGWWFFYGI